MFLTTINTPISSMGSWVGSLPAITFSQVPVTPIFTDSFLNEILTPVVQIIVFEGGTPIPDSDLALRNPVAVEIQTTRDGFVIRSSGLDEEAYGSTYQEAYVEFLTSLRDRFYSLIRREAYLSSEDLAILNKLRILLEEPKEA